MSASLEFRQVSKWYRQVSALIEVSAAIGPGVTGLVGQNGAGKTTLLKLAAGLLRPSLGEVRVCGESPRAPAARRRLGFCPDIDRFYEGLSGRTFVTWMLRLQGYSRASAGRTASAMLQQLGLAHAMDRKIAGYSLGMRQRVNLAQALAHEPEVVVLDEPLTGLDPVARHDIGELVRELGRRGVVVVVSSHVLHELEHVADHFVLMHQGRVTAEGNLRQLREQLADRPREVMVRGPDARGLASRLSQIEQVERIEIGATGITIAVRGAGVFEQLTAIGAEPGDLVHEIRVLDDSLEAVFGYLVS